MPLNIIIRGKYKRTSNEELAENLHDHTARKIAEEKAGYMDRQLKARKAVEGTGSKTFRPVAVYDAKTYFRHESDNPGCMNDPEYKKSYLKKNPEAKL